MRKTRKEKRNEGKGYLTQSQKAALWFEGLPKETQELYYDEYMGPMKEIEIYTKNYMNQIAHRWYNVSPEEFWNQIVPDFISELQAKLWNKFLIVMWKRDVEKTLTKEDAITYFWRAYYNQRNGSYWDLVSMYNDPATVSIEGMGKEDEENENTEERVSDITETFLQNYEDQLMRDEKIKELIRIVQDDDDCLAYINWVINGMPEPESTNILNKGRRKLVKRFGVTGKRLQILPSVAR